MNKKQSNNISIFKFLGITPQTIIIFIIGVAFSGVILGLLIQNSLNTKKKKKINNIEQVKEDIVENIISNNNIVNEIKEGEIIDNQSDISIDSVQIFKNSLYNENKYILDKKVDTPVVAIVIDDMGIDMLRSNKMLNVPDLYTMSFLTYSPNLQSQIDFAKEKKHEVLLHVPMEAVHNIYDYGPEFLKTTDSRESNLKILNNILDRVSGYIGINNHMGSKFTADLPLLSAVIEELSNRGLGFLDSKTTALSKADEIVSHIKLPYASRDVFLDDSNKIEDIEASLIKLEKIAKKRGYAIAIGHPRDNTIKALENWLPTLNKKGITSVPLSYIIDNY